jgi:ubiquinone/menaquinone biosynthesis C-methylase UbiE
LEDWRYQELYELEERHWWFRSRRRFVWALMHRAGISSPARVLDAGCGTGRNLLEFGKLAPEAEGVDFSEEAVAFCRRRGLEGVRQARLEELPFPDDRFDLLIATDVIEHLEDDRRALVELRRVAAPGAQLVITVPAYRWLWSQHDESHHHRRRYTMRRLREAVGDAGWTPTVSSYYYTTMLPAVAAVRAAGKLRPATTNGRSDLALTPAALNRVLELPVRAESALVERGMRLPFGVSLGMVCSARDRQEAGIYAAARR